MAVGWQTSLSFAERLEATSKMQVTLTASSSSAYKAAHPACSSSEASKHAKSSEETARKNAGSSREYHERCAKAVRLLLDSAPTASNPEPQTEDHVSSLPNAGMRIGRYENAEHFKNGLFSEIYKASLPASEQKQTQFSIVALKVTVPSVMTAPHDAVREARILAAAKHDNIVPLLETFQQAGGRFVLVLPFMPYDLETLLNRMQLTDRSSKGILKDVFSGIAHLHKLGIIHRDIKPSNILLSSPSAPAYLADFGIAWSSSDHASEPPLEKILDVGTTCYRPPELLFGHQAYGTSLDMWAAGCLAAQVVCLNGKTLFDAGDLGSELALIKSIFETLGTPDLDVWPEAGTFPDWGKMNFRQYPSKPWHEILHGADQAAIDLVSRLVIFESSLRLTAREALEHSYLLE